MSCTERQSMNTFIGIKKWYCHRFQAIIGTYKLWIRLQIMESPYSQSLALRPDPGRAPPPYSRRPAGGVVYLRVVYLSPADKYPRLTRRLSQEQKDLDERALMASQRPAPPW
jgi:hypothetical protein